MKKREAMGSNWRLASQVMERGEVDPSSKYALWRMDGWRHGPNMHHAKEEAVDVRLCRRVSLFSPFGLSVCTGCLAVWLSVCLVGWLSIPSIPSPSFFPSYNRRPNRRAIRHLLTIAEDSPQPDRVQMARQSQTGRPPLAALPAVAG